MFLPNSLIGWIVGHDLQVLKTIDGGLTWTLQYQNKGFEAPFLDILFLDEYHGYAIGGYGALFETIDGGDNWRDVVLI